MRRRAALLVFLLALVVVPGAASSKAPGKRALWGIGGNVSLSKLGGDTASLNSVSCPSVGTCAAGGFYTDSSGGSQAFVVSKR